MRILHAADFHGISPGSFIPLIAALARHLASRGDTFALVVPRVAGATWYDDLHATNAELIIADDIGVAIRAIRNWAPDIVHVHFYGWEIPLTVALFTLRARLFWHAHSVYRWDRPSRPSLRTIAKYRLLGARVERFVTVSQAVASELKRVGAPSQRIAVVRNGVDSRRFRPPTSDERADARQALQLTSSRAILFFGRNPRLKGADVLASALAGMPGHTVIAVSTPPEACEALAQNANVIAIDHSDDVVPLLWAADVLAVPSRGEGFGLVLLEAAMTGLAVAASDLPALREAAGSRPNVRFAKVGDAVSLKIALKQALYCRQEDIPRLDEGDPLTAWATSIATLYDYQCNI